MEQKSYYYIFARAKQIDKNNLQKKKNTTSHVRYQGTASIRESVNIFCW